MTRRAFPEPFVARVRAALHAGISHKAIVNYSGASVNSIARISCGTIQPDVPPDPELAAILSRWLNPQILDPKD